ncbi:hypothetical protein [Schleiferilactobacillus harbinensis]|uniref:Uncharacterized protein n=1 Tax=Schleiferilactobacillus harbinensis TaxID=304207 RepID=A0A5P8M6D9_9LACO|nr:hypothetical protein [Schleiferilactobacillus harbinensis]QFR24076.1 hypothetical protein D1010_12165 [Schleiferilactobacillus harbinensis]
MYNFVTDKDGNIVGHSDPEFAEFQEGGVTMYPDPAYRPDEDNLWAIKSGKMVHRATGLTPQEEQQQTYTQLLNTAANNAAGNKQLQTAVTTVMGAQAQLQVAMTTLTNALAASAAKEGSK